MRTRIFSLIAVTLILAGCAHSVTKTIRTDGTTVVTEETRWVPSPGVYPLVFVPLDEPRYYRGRIQGREIYTSPYGYIQGARQWTNPVVVRGRDGTRMLVCWPGVRHKPVDQRGECHD